MDKDEKQEVIGFVGLVGVALAIISAAGALIEAAVWIEENFGFMGLMLSVGLLGAVLLITSYAAHEYVEKKHE